MSDIDPTDLFSEFDDGPPDKLSDESADTADDPLARLNAANLLESLASSDPVPDFSSADHVTSDSSLVEEPPLKEGDTGVPRPSLSESGGTPLPVSGREAQPPLPPNRDAVTDERQSETDYRDDLTPDFAKLLSFDDGPSIPDELPLEEEGPYQAAVTPTLPMPSSDTEEEGFMRSELSTEPAPPDTDGIDSTDTPPTGPAGQGDVVVRVFFPRLPGEEPPDSAPASAPPWAAKAAQPTEPDLGPWPAREEESEVQVEQPLEDTGPEVETPTEETDPSKIETRPHPQPGSSDVIDILSPRSSPSEPEHVPVIQEFSWSDIEEPIVQESFGRDDKLADEPLGLSPAFEQRPRWRGTLIWLIVGTIAAILLIAAGIGLWSVFGPSIGASLAGLFGGQVTPTLPSGVLLEPTTVVQPEPTPRPTVTPRPQPSLTPEPPTVLTDEGIIQHDIPMVYVPGGSFEMGSGAQGHRVTLSPYYFDMYEITNEAYARCVEAGGCTEPQSEENYAGDIYYGAPAFWGHPVINVTWDQASTYCLWRGVRLPTEAEWEMAARINPETGVESVYPWGSQWDPTRLNYCDASCALAANADPTYNDTWPQTARVGSFGSGVSGIGAMDLAGNVSEWVADWFAADYYLVSPEQDPQGPETGQDRVIRGGAWGVSNPNLFLSTARTHFDPTTSGPGTGFRCAVSASDVEGLPTDESQEDT